MAHSVDQLPAVLGELIVVSNKLTRMAAQLTDGTESPAVWRTLSALRHAGPVRLGGLAALSRVAQPTMTKLVHTLVERGWVQRVADPADARATLLAATESGEAALEAWRTELIAAILPQFEGLDPDEIAAIARAVGIVQQRLDAPIATTKEA
ncbi:MULTISPECIES: MarR family winged helix-turn-helix transcriptional regulator [Microterricola]|uniref:DNA-binding transcriptional regulator, MarR family n=2 Tax=Microterricola TaxID=518733 RepID=A0A1H1ZH15_9MICO|nr:MULTISPECIES: MarR family transcriptional regulator [Microterricola]PPL16126.1 MarR family transcriptional regulator [Microterricola pindariensis]SDT32929.1 DNA-binding transcriptional regulator, MarR family [Microterricola viridarii]